MPAMVCSVVPRITGLPCASSSWIPLALADRVVAEHGHPVLGQQDARPLILLVRLAVVAVAARQSTPGNGGLPSGR